MTIHVWVAWGFETNSLIPIFVYCCFSVIQISEDTFNYILVYFDVLLILGFFQNICFKRKLSELYKGDSDVIMIHKGD